MPLFEMIKYHKHEYPKDIKICTEEIAGLYFYNSCMHLLYIGVKDMLR